MARKSKKVTPAAELLRWGLATGAAHRRALEGERDHHHSSCGGSRWIRHFDTDYPCQGCTGCDRLESLGHNLSRAGELESRTWARALSAIGAAIAAALLPGLAFESLIASSIVAWNTVEKGRWYRVDGARGRAAEVQGQVGLVKWIGTEERRSQYGTWSYGSTTRAGLQIAGREKLAYVSVGNLTPVPEPVEARTARVAKEQAKADKAARDSVRPKFSGRVGGKKPTPAVVLTGTHAGRVGVVFWMGVTKRGSESCGVKFCSCGKRCNCEVAWLDPRDVVPATPVGLSPIELADGTTVNTDEQAEMVVLALVAVGADAAAAEWAQFAKGAS